MQNTLTGLVAAAAAIAALMLSSVEAQPPKNQAARASTAQPKLPPINPSRLIGNVLYIEAPGCESRAQHFDLGIPDAGRLDTAHQGIVPGIEFQETTHVGRAGVRNVVFNGSTLSFDLFADGAGTIQGGGQIDGPFGIKINNPIPRTCVGAAGASYGIKIVAFYR
jgi:hypothetical protein